MTEWYYIGHYGRLGPLTRDQIDELVEGGVITQETYVWHTGMSDWSTADTVPALSTTLRQSAPFVAPPPPPTTPNRFPTGPTATYAPQPTQQYPVQSYSHSSLAFNSAYSLKSNKSRVVAGVLNLIIPGAGRMYLGYLAYGVMQLILTLCSFGTLWVWSFVDGVIMLSGGLKHDGYGRILTD